VAADQDLVNRVRTALAGRVDAQEKRMFGGITFMVAKRCASVWGGIGLCATLVRASTTPCWNAKGAGRS